MKQEKITKIRMYLGMTQKEFAFNLGVGRLTVSQWETRFRKPSPLALRAIEMLKEIEGDNNKRNRAESIIKKRFNWLNRELFEGELKGNYRIELNKRIKSTLGRAIPSKKSICLKASFFETGNWERLDNTLIHEMLHCWLYEKGRKWGHTNEFKTKLNKLKLKMKRRI